jgi:hypothetical protein
MRLGTWQGLDEGGSRQGRVANEYHYDPFPGLRAFKVVPSSL